MARCGIERNREHGRRDENVVASASPRRALGSLLAALALTFSLALAPGAANAREDVPADIARKQNPVSLEDDELRYYERQFKGKCARCHGKDGTGKGSEPVKPPLVDPADFTDAAFMATRTDGQLFYQIRMGGGDRCAMPAFGPESDHAWSDDKIWHMVAFVRRFATTPAP